MERKLRYKSIRSKLVLKLAPIIIVFLFPTTSEQHLIGSSKRSALFNIFNHANNPNDGSPKCGAAPKLEPFLLVKRAHHQHHQHHDEQPYLISEAFDVKPGQFPFLVKIKFEDHRQISYCTGAIISPIHIITAAHCLAGQRIESASWSRDLRLGDHGAWEKFENNCTHPKYRIHAMRGDIYDVAVLTVRDAIEFDDDVQPICLFSRHPTSFEQCFTMGYSMIDLPEEKKVAQFMPVKRFECPQRFSAESRVCFLFSSKYAPGQTCPGDYGGPIACWIDEKWELHGISSSSLNMPFAIRFFCRIVENENDGTLLVYDAVDDIRSVLEMSLGRCRLKFTDHI